LYGVEEGGYDTLVGMNDWTRPWVEPRQYVEAHLARFLVLKI
jgi:hypothetical protein